MIVEKHSASDMPKLMQNALLQVKCILRPSPVYAPRMVDPSQRLRELREKRGFATATQAAAAFGWNKFTYTQHENGTRDLSRKAAQRYATAYLSSAGWLLYGERGPSGTKARTAPIVRFAGIIGAGQQVEPSDQIDGEVMGLVVTEPSEAFEVAGDSMLPVAMHGDIVFCGLPVDPRQLIGRECIVELDDGRRFLKRLRRGSVDGLYDLESYNASTIADVKVIRAGRLLGIRRSR